MILYHGSNLLDLKYLKPQISNHCKPFVYFTDVFELAVLYAAKNPINTYWFKDGILHYDEYFEDQFEVLHNGKSGEIYVCDAEFKQLERMPWVFLSENAVEVDSYMKIDNIYDVLRDFENDKRLVIHRYNDFSEKEKELNRKQIEDEIIKENLVLHQDKPYSVFIRQYFPDVWNDVVAKGCEK